MGGRIYHQVEDSVTEDMASGEKYHRLGYMSIFSPGVYETGRGPLGLRDFMKVQVHRWARGAVGELRLSREKGSPTTLNKIINDRQEFSKDQRKQYWRTMTYYLTSITSAVSMSSPLLFMLLSDRYEIPSSISLATVIGLQLSVRTWLYPSSLIQRGGSFYESFALMGLTLINWQRWGNAVDNALIKKIKTPFGVTRKEGPNIKIGTRGSDFARLGLGPYIMTAANFIAFPLGLFLSVVGDEYDILPALWGTMGLYFATIMSIALKRYNQGAESLPPKNGESLLKMMEQSNDPKVLKYLLREANNEEMEYSASTRNGARELYERKVKI